MGDRLDPQMNLWDRRLRHCDAAERAGAVHDGHLGGVSFPLFAPMQARRLLITRPIW